MLKNRYRYTWKYLYEIVTDDEFWTYGYESESKNHTKSFGSSKINQICTFEQIMVCFWPCDEIPKRIFPHKIKSPAHQLKYQIYGSLAVQWLVDTQWLIFITVHLEENLVFNDIQKLSHLESKIILIMLNIHTVRWSNGMLI